MFKINEVKKVIEVILNKNHHNVLTANKFNTLLNIVIFKVYNYYIDLYRNNDYKKQIQRDGLSFNRLQGILNTFLTPINISSGEGGYYYYPDDCEFANSLSYNNEIIEFVDAKKSIILKSLDGYLDVTKDAMVAIDLGNKCEVITYEDEPDFIKLWYYRSPKVPKWTSSIIGNTEIFNPAAKDFQDIEFPNSVIPKIILEMCYLVGINLRESDVAQLMNNEINEEYKQEMI